MGSRISRGWPGVARLGWANVVVGVLAGASAAAAGEIRFAKPIDCVLGETCFVQNYVDHDPGPGAKDLFCGPRTYNRHTGTDIRIPNLGVMREGVAVLAAAPGRVRRIRDDMADISFREIGDAAIEGRSCGNAAVVDHGGGWQTIYCHMRRGSVVVQPGQQVSAGQKLGLVGLSGRTEFPHVHFEVRHRGALVDPYVGPNVENSGAGVGTCSGPLAPMWRNPIADGLVYAPAAVIGAGFTDVVPTTKLLEAGEHLRDTLRPDAPSLLFWVRVIGIVPGAEQALHVVGPAGKVWARARPRDVDRPKALAWNFVSKRRRGADWPTGVYKGEYRLTRDGRLLLRKVVRVRVE